MRRWRPWCLALVVIGATYGLGGLVATRFKLGPVDDAYISLRYAANWAGGRGLCFNPGERVEGYTNFLLVALQAAAIRCGADPERTMTVISRASHALLAGAFALFVHTHILRRREGLAIATGVLLGVNAALVCWGASGLESCLYALLLVVSVGLAVGRGRRHWPVASAVCLILAAMTRPEGAILLPVLMVIVHLKAAGTRLGGAGVPPVFSRAREVVKKSGVRPSATHKAVEKRGRDAHATQFLHRLRRPCHRATRVGRPCDPAMRLGRRSHPVAGARPVWQVARYAAIFVVGFGAYFVIRAVHFGYPFPNTFYAKLDYGNTLLVKRGLLYVWDFIIASPLLVLPALLGAVLVRGAPLWVKACALMAGAQIAIVVYEGGDHFAMFRFMVPVLPFLVGLALYPWRWARVRYRLAGRPASVILAVILAAVGASAITIGMPTKRGAWEALTQFEHFATEVYCTEQWAEMGRYFRGSAPPDATLGTIAIGAIGYHSGLRIVDPHGIVDASIAHRECRLGAGYAGHEKYSVDAVLDRRPSFLLLLNTFTDGPVPPGDVARRLWGSFNAAIIQHPKLASDYRYESIRLRNKYLNLHVRRDLPTPTGRSPDPHDSP